MASTHCLTSLRLPPPYLSQVPTLSNFAVYRARLRQEEARDHAAPSGMHNCISAALAPPAPWPTATRSGVATPTRGIDRSQRDARYFSTAGAGSSKFLHRDGASGLGPVDFTIGLRIGV